MTTPPIAAVVLTLNEAEHLPECLASLRPLTERVLVLDSGSTDGTQEIATAGGARLRTRTFDGYASQRNAALEMVDDAEWTVFLDADERLTAAGVSELLDIIRAANDDLAALWLPRRNIFFGREIRGGGWWPDHQARALRRGRACYDPARQVHEVAIVDGASRFLTEPLIHLNYATRREFVEKQRAYTLRRVAEAPDHGTPRRRALLSAPARELWRRLVQLEGYRDGGTGVFLATVLAVEELRACWLLRRTAAER